MENFLSFYSKKPYFPAQGWEGTNKLSINPTFPATSHTAKKTRSNLKHPRRTLFIACRSPIAIRGVSAMVVDDADDYDSDTFVAERPQNPYANLGQASIASMMARSGADRRESKIATTNLRYTTAVPSTERSRYMWAGRFDAFRTLTLRREYA
jgi:hypothetical protein